jgi:hypothetical protein
LRSRSTTVPSTPTPSSFAITYLAFTSVACYDHACEEFLWLIKYPGHGRGILSIRASLEKSPVILPGHARGSLAGFAWILPSSRPEKFREAKFLWIQKNRGASAAPRFAGHDEAEVS